VNSVLDITLINYGRIFTNASVIYDLCDQSPLNFPIQVSLCIREVYEMALLL
jgi:hypothetical protein